MDLHINPSSVNVEQKGLSSFLLFFGGTEQRQPLGGYCKRSHDDAGAMGFSSSMQMKGKITFPI